MTATARSEPTEGVGAWFVVVILAVAQIVSTVDRGLLSLVIDPIRHDLAISEIQVAMLQGFAFAIFYVTVGLPLGMFADAVNRRWLLIGGVLVWTAATIAGGFAHNFREMFASRLFIGVGEAVLGPCAVTIIGDLFPAHRRGRPMAVYVLGSMIAFGVGSVIAGYVLEVAPKGAFDAIPFLRGRAPWRVAFITIGASGFLIAALLLFLREPARVGGSDGETAPWGLKATLGYFSLNRLFLFCFYGALATFALGASVATGWGAVLLSRVYGYTPALAGRSLGFVEIVWALLGAVAAGLLVDRVARRWGPAGKVRLGAILALAAIPSCIAVAALNGPLATVMIGEIMFATAVYGATMLSVITDLAPVRVRGVSVALYAFVMTMIGGSLGPLCVAYLTEKVFADPKAVGFSMAIVGAVALMLSALFAFFAGRTLQADSGAIDHQRLRWVRA